MYTLAVIVIPTNVPRKRRQICPSKRMMNEESIESRINQWIRTLAIISIKIFTKYFLQYEVVVIFY